ncbi:helix-turn-helix transcriptional regulator [Photobacterium leiognathi]|uniref:helix-turn-helix transcriptional regulator n=1 Tax=Photobacterium leiognathi TaxID=553611 RepID=UPI0006B5914E|nr:helix-turn-helix transcriptional regulator [Photobacterium leiognathi]
MKKSAHAYNVQQYIAEHIKKARLLNGVTQVAMATILGVARQTYLDIESGKTESKSVMIYNIAKATKKPIHYFYPDDETKHATVIENALARLSELEHQTSLLKRDLSGRE